MTKRRSLLQVVSTYNPPPRKEAVWVGGLRKSNPKLLREVLEVIEAYARGKLEDKFTSPPALARFLIKTAGVKASERTITEYIKEVCKHGNTGK